MPSWSTRSPWTSIIGASPCRWLLDSQRPETSGEPIRTHAPALKPLKARLVLTLDMSEHMFYSSAQSTWATGREELLWEFPPTFSTCPWGVVENPKSPGQGAVGFTVSNVFWPLSERSKSVGPSHPHSIHGQTERLRIP